MNALDHSFFVSLDDAALTQKLASLVCEERVHLVDFLRHLAAFDTRKLFRGFGYSSLHAYCRDELKLSEASSFRRYTAARLLVRFPAIADFLADGRLNLTRLAMLKDVLTPENHLDLLARASAGSERDVEVLVATLRPRPDVTDSIRKLPSRAGITSAAEVVSAPPAIVASAPRIAPDLFSSNPVAAAQSLERQADVAPSPADVTSAAEVTRSPAPENAGVDDAVSVSPTIGQHGGASASVVTSAAEVPARPRPRMEVEATSATAFAVRLRVSPEFLAEFEAVKAALSHKFPDGNFEDILRECFRVTLEACERRRAARTTRCGTGSPPRETDATGPAKTHTATESTKSPSVRSRYIPAAVRRAVWKRDGNACAFVSSDGKRCGSRHQLELHHIIPFASGGPSTEENLSLRCRQHNAHEADLAFGADFMKAAASRRPPAPSVQPPPRRLRGNPLDSSPPDGKPSPH